jgi:hypothetical protein
VTVGAVTAGTQTAAGTATHWALIDVGNSALLATNALSASTTMVGSGTFDTGSFTIIEPAAVSQ